MCYFSIKSVVGWGGAKSGSKALGDYFVQQGCCLGYELLLHHQD
jgi:hypothetical protein